MSLYVEEYSTDTNDLREDFRTDHKHISNYFRELGCKVVPVNTTEQLNLRLTKVEAKTHKMAKLKIPLEFPEARTGPRNGGQGRR
jgi:DNA-directed RNA polymerase I subunit RPA49